MASRIDYRHASKFPTATVYAALVDRAFLQARLTEIGGPEASVVEYRSDAGGAAYRLRHKLNPAGLPAAVRTLLAGNLVIERAETWTPGPDGGHRGTLAVGVIGSPVPASASGQQGVADLTGGGSEFVLRAEISVSVPLFGGQIEEYVGGQIRGLLDMEWQFTTRWLEQNAT